MKKSRAFTLVEFLVAIAIITIMSAVIFYNFPRFNQNVLVNREARALTLALRDAQSRAVAISEFGKDGGGLPIFPSNYGVHIESDHYVIFSDRKPPSVGSCPECAEDLKYGGTDTATTCTGECFKRFPLPDNVRIVNIKNGGNTSCSPSGADDTKVNILFYRPDPKMKITSNTGTVLGEEGSVTCSGYGPFKIRLSNPDGSLTKTVELWLTGQISIK